MWISHFLNNYPSYPNNRGLNSFKILGTVRCVRKFLKPVTPMRKERKKEETKKNNNHKNAIFSFHELESKVESVGWYSIWKIARKNRFDRHRFNWKSHSQSKIHKNFQIFSNLSEIKTDAERSTVESYFACDLRRFNFTRDQNTLTGMTNIH